MFSRTARAIEDEDLHVKDAMDRRMAKRANRPARSRISTMTDNNANGSTPRLNGVH